MATSGNFTNKFWALRGKFPDHEERCTGVVALQKVEKLWSDGGIRTVIESNGELARRVCAANG
jgi:hypothetical protein